MARYLDPKNDLPFKRVFGEHPHLCISLLNSMLPLDESQKIVSIEYQTGELIPEIVRLKNSIVDVRCTDKLGRQFIVEMQMHWSESFKSRVLLNASKAYVKQLDRSKKYHLLQPVYALNFVNEIFEPTMEEYYHHYKIVNVSNTEKQIEGLEFVFIELPKFKPKNLKEKKLQVLWLRFLTEIKDSTESIPQELLQEDDIKEAVHYLEQGAYTKKQLYTYDKVWDAIMTEQSVMADSENKGRAEGKAEGIAEGVDIGKAEGKAEGIAEGVDIGIEKGKAEVVITGHRNGFSIEQIQSFTGLSKEQIVEILKQAGILI